MTREQLIAKVKTTQALDSDDSKCILNSNNNTPGKVLLMFDIIDKANTYWENDDDATDQTDTAETLFMFEVVKIDQRIEFKDLYLNYENTFTFDAEGKFDLNTLLETHEYSEMTDAPFVLSVVTDSGNTTAPAGYTLEDGILAIDLEAAEDPLGSWYIQITKAGDVGHNDYTAYFTVKAEPNYIGNEAQDYTRWLQNAENNQYYKTAEESGEEYDGFVFTSGMTIAEILGTMPEQFTTDFGTFAWYRQIGSSAEYEEVPTDSQITGDCELRLYFIPHEELKWIVQEGGDTYYSINLYVENA